MESTDGNNTIRLSLSDNAGGGCLSRRSSLLFVTVDRARTNMFRRSETDNFFDYLRFFQPPIYVLAKWGGDIF